MTATRLKAVVFGVLVVGAAAFVAVLQYRARVALEKENEALRAQVEQLSQVKAENEDQLAQSRNSFTDKEKSELLRLRGEVGLLRKETNELGKLRENNRRLQQSLAERPATAQPRTEEAISEFATLVAIPKMNDAKALCLGLVSYANDNGSRLPANVEDIAAYLKTPDAPPLTGTNQFELVYHGLLNQLTNPGKVILFRETTPSQTPNGKWAKAYGFADGHSEFHSEPDGNFEPWEKQHIISPSSPQ